MASPAVETLRMLAEQTPAPVAGMASPSGSGRSSVDVEASTASEDSSDQEVEGMIRQSEFSEQYQPPFAPAVHRGPSSMLYGSPAALPARWRAEIDLRPPVLWLADLPKTDWQYVRQPLIRASARAVEFQFSRVLAVEMERRKLGVPLTAYELFNCYWDSIEAYVTGALYPEAIVAKLKQWHDREIRRVDTLRTRLLATVVQCPHCRSVIHTRKKYA